VDVTSLSVLITDGGIVSGLLNLLSTTTDVEGVTDDDVSSTIASFGRFAALLLTTSIATVSAAVATVLLVRISVAMPMLVPDANARWRCWSVSAVTLLTLDT